METPLSNRRITRSLAAAAAASSAQKSAADSAAHFTRTKNTTGTGETRGALQDITNDSPIVGLAAGGNLHNKTPAATATKTCPRPRRTPGSGEALLRGQVKALLHKIHEEQGSADAAAVARPPSRIQALLGVARSPAQLLAPTPANTPQIGGASAGTREGLLLPDGYKVMPCVLEEEDSLIPKLQIIAASQPPSPLEEKLSEGQLSRALVFDDSPGKSELFNGSSSLKLFDSTSGGSNTDKSSSSEDDSSSIWSMQVHASSEKGDVEELGEDLGTPKYTEEEEEDAWGEEDSDDDERFDELCQGMSKMTVFDEKEEKAGGLPQFEGKHTRFIYNSDGEVEREEVVPSAEAKAELFALLLRGMPVPEGRHLRFHEDDEDEE